MPLTRRYGPSAERERGGHAGHDEGLVHQRPGGVHLDGEVAGHGHLGYVERDLPRHAAGETARGEQQQGRAVADGEDAGHPEVDVGAGDPDDGGARGRGDLVEGEVAGQRLAEDAQRHPGGLEPDERAARDLERECRAADLQRGVDGGRRGVHREGQGARGREPVRQGECDLAGEPAGDARRGEDEEAAAADEVEAVAAGAEVQAGPVEPDRRGRAAVRGGGALDDEVGDEGLLGQDDGDAGALDAEERPAGRSIRLVVVPNVRVRVTAAPVVLIDRARSPGPGRPGCSAPRVPDSRPARPVVPSTSEPGAVAERARRRRGRARRGRRRGPATRRPPCRRRGRR